MMLSPRLIAAVLALLALGGGFWKTYISGRDAGRAQVQAAWDAERVEVARQMEALRTQRERVVTKVVTEYVQQAAQDRVVYRDILKEVPVHVPIDSCDLPAGFRLLHDAAAQGQPVPSPGDPARVDAAAVPARAAAAAVVMNYETCRADQARLKALQDIVRQLGGEHAEKAEQ